MKQTAKWDKMRQTPVRRLMLSTGVPMILSMVLQALYNIVDSAFISHMTENGEAALNALTLAFPMQMLMVSVSIGTGVGVNALAAKTLGQGDREEAGRVAGNAQVLAAGIYVLFVLFGLFGVRGYIATQTANPLIAEMAQDYLSICCAVSFGIIFFSIYEKLLQATGHSVYSSIAQVVGAVVNMVLDPILIYGWFGLPEMGVRGAAWATVIGQCASAVLAFVFHRTVNREFATALRYFKPSGALIKKIYAVGLPAMIAQALMSVMTYGLNILLGMVGEDMVTAYGLYYKIQQFLLFAAFGLRDAITPIVSYSHGMRSAPRMRDGVKYGLLYTLSIMFVGTVAVEVLAVPLARLFGLSGETEALCVSAIRIISLSFVFAGVSIAMQGVFQALNGGLESLVVSLGRQLVFVLPVAGAFTALVNRGGAPRWLLWTTFPIAEVITAVIACFLLRRIWRRTVIDHLPAAERSPAATGGKSTAG